MKVSIIFPEDSSDKPVGIDIEIGEHPERDDYAINLFCRIRELVKIMDEDDAVDWHNTIKAAFMILDEAVRQMETTTNWRDANAKNIN